MSLDESGLQLQLSLYGANFSHMLHIYDPFVQELRAR